MMRKGLFGKSMMPGVISGYGGGTFNLDGTQATSPDEITYTPQAQSIVNGATPMPAPQRFWQGGDKFTLRDGLAGALAAIGDGLSNWSGGGGGAVGNLLQSRAAPVQKTAALAEEQRKRAADLADYEAKQKIDVRYTAPKVNDTVADFEFFKGLSPQDRALYEQMRPVYRQGADGQFYRVDTGGQQPSAGFDALPEGYSIRQGGAASNGSGSF